MRRSRWDVLFALLELKEATLSSIAKRAGTSPSSSRQRLRDLIEEAIVVQRGTLYAPNSNNERVWKVQGIMQFCKSRKLDYNLFLTLEFARIVRTGLSSDQVTFSEFQLNHQTVRKYLSMLSSANLVLITSRRPLVVRFVAEPIFDSVLELFGMKREKRKISKRTEASEYVEIEKMLKSLKGRVTDEAGKIEFTSSSTRLEGNTFTLDEARELILKDNVPAGKKLKEANEIRNFYLATNYLIEHLFEKLSPSFIMELHHITTFNLGVRPGFREANVSMKGNPNFKTLHFTDISSAIGRLCEDVNAFLSSKRNAQEIVEYATFVHNEFLHIFPFEDGNSRLTRLLWNYVLMRSGFPLINIYANVKEEYLSLTKLTRERDDTKLNEFLTKVIKDNLYKIVK